MAGTEKEYSNEAIEKAKGIYSRRIDRGRISPWRKCPSQMDMSPYYFSKLFKEVTGSNFVEYVTGSAYEPGQKAAAGGQEQYQTDLRGKFGYSDSQLFQPYFQKV